MPDEKQIQWFPGHMAKTRRMMKESLPDVDIVLELLDARIPYSSKNPEIRRIIGDKPLITIFNKAGMADPAVTAKWRKWYEDRGNPAVALDCITGEGVSDLKNKVREVLADKIARYEAKGMGTRRLKAMLVGIPNVGKSSLINRLAGGKHAKVENRPGVTLTKQWVSTSIGLTLLDMPGVLWPKFDEKKVGENLAVTGAIRDPILDMEEVAVVLVGRLRAVAPALLAERYHLSPEETDGRTDGEVMELIGQKRGFLIRGGEIDFRRTAEMLIDEFRSTKIGRISLEIPPQKET